MIYFNPPEFCYIRVPKTGSTTFVRAIEKWGKRNHKQGNYTLNHTRAYNAKDRLPEWDHVWTFGFIRNPWAWYVSFYNHSMRDEPKKQRSHHSFQTYLQDSLEISPLLWLGEKEDNTQILVDTVYKTEDTPKLGEKFTGVFGEEFELDIQLNAGPKVNYRDYYDDETKRLVERRCAAEIELGKYLF